MSWMRSGTDLIESVSEGFLTYFCMGKSKNYYFLETIAALGLKVACSIQLNELMKLSEYQRLRSFFDLGQRSLRFQS